MLALVPRIMGGVGTNQEEARQEIELDWCGDKPTPCSKPRTMLGMSWWKCLGYNSPCRCVHTFLNLGLETSLDIEEYLKEEYPEMMGDC